MIELRKEDFCIDEIIRKMKNPDTGAISSYLGTVREFPLGNGLEFEEEENVIQKLNKIEQRAIEKFDIRDVAIIHRVGFLGVSENILLIVVSAPHRGPAFDACRSIIDDIKNLHKTWGKETAK